MALTLRTFQCTAVTRFSAGHVCDASADFCRFGPITPSTDQADPRGRSGQGGPEAPALGEPAAIARPGWRQGHRQACQGRARRRRQEDRQAGDRPRCRAPGADGCRAGLGFTADRGSHPHRACGQGRRAQATAGAPPAGPGGIRPTLNRMLADAHLLPEQGHHRARHAREHL